MFEYGKAVVVGDIHGDYTRFEELVRTVEAEHGSVQWLTTGDLIDRGPDSKKVLDLAYSIDMRGVHGNHELWLLHLLRYREFNDEALSTIMGGKFTLDSYGFHSPYTNVEEELWRIPEKHKTFLERLTIHHWFTVGGDRFLLTHGGIHKSSYSQIVLEFMKAGVPHDPVKVVDILSRTAPNTILWVGAGRGENVAIMDGVVQIYGHSPGRTAKAVLTKKEPKTGFVALDTGASTCYEKKLTALVLPEWKLVTV